MPLSSIIATAKSGRLGALADAVSRIEGAQVYNRDPATDRLICIIDAPDADSHADVFNRIRRLEDALDASLFEFNFEDEEEV